MLDIVLTLASAQKEKAIRVAFLDQVGHGHQARP